MNWDYKGKCLDFDDVPLLGPYNDEELFMFKRDIFQTILEKKYAENKVFFWRTLLIVYAVLFTIAFVVFSVGSYN